MRTLFLVRCSMCRRMMPNFVDCFGSQSRAWTSPPQKYLQSLAFEVSTDTCPCPQLQHLLPPSPPPGNWFLLSSLPPPLPQIWDGNNGTLGGVASSSFCSTWVLPGSFYQYLPAQRENWAALHRLPGDRRMERKRMILLEILA